jgi:hypothetical protein
MAPVNSPGEQPPATDAPPWVASLRPRYRRILEECRPFLVTYRGNLPHLDRSPFGLAISPELCFDPTERRSASFIDSLHVLDGVAFGGKGMLMPRWVLFDCGELPGIVFGFARRAGDLPRRAQEIYAAPPDAMVALSMWIAIPTAEPGTWVGHNLASANEVLEGDALPGLATLTKALGIRVARAKKQVGVTQWASPSVGIHLTFGDLRLLSAWTPAHSIAESFCYCMDVSEGRLLSSFMEGYDPPIAQFDREIDPGDAAALVALQDEIEAGAEYSIVGLAPRSSPAPSRAYLRRAAGI